jgi:integrase
MDAQNAVSREKVWTYLKFGFRSKFKLLDMFRRTRGTDLYQQGIPIELVARHLGHSCLETTRTYYARPSLEMLSSAISSASSFESEEKQLWTDKEEDLARLCGLA